MIPIKDTFQIYILSRRRDRKNSSEALKKKKSVQRL